MVLCLRLFGYKFALICDGGVLLLNLILIIVIKKKNCQTHRSNSINVDWVGLGWILVMSWVKFDFFNLPWWFELKKFLNPIHAHHYFNYVTSNFCYIRINTYTSNFIIFKVINYITFLSILLFTNYNLSKKKNLIYCATHIFLSRWEINTVVSTVFDDRAWVLQYYLWLNNSHLNKWMWNLTPKLWSIVVTFDWVASLESLLLSHWHCRVIEFTQLSRACCHYHSQS